MNEDQEERSAAIVSAEMTAVESECVQYNKLSMLARS